MVEETNRYQRRNLIALASFMRRCIRLLSHAQIPNRFQGCSVARSVSEVMRDIACVAYD